jgi:hypothetical protein
MSTYAMDEVFASGVRSTLVGLTNGSIKVRSRRWRLRIGLCALAGAVVIGGGTAAIATNTSPPPPGAPFDTPLGSPIVVSGTGSSEIDLEQPPSGANAISYALTCLTAGSFTLPDGTLICSNTDPPSTSLDDLPISSGTSSIALTTTPGAQWRFQYTFVEHNQLPLQTNASGETYGVSNGTGSDSSTPDLVGVVIDGGTVTGYVKQSDLTCASGGSPANPAAALAWDKESQNLRVMIPVYKSDGHTVIGSFGVGQGPGPGIRTVPLSALDCSQSVPTIAGSTP